MMYPMRAMRMKRMRMMRKMTTLRFMVARVLELSRKVGKAK